MQASNSRPLLRVILFSLMMKLGMSCAYASLIPLDYTVPTSAQVQTSPPQIILSWPADADARMFNVYRKLITDASWGNPIAVLPTGATGFKDTNVTVGSAFEYQIEEPTDYFPWPNGNPSQWLTAYGYIYAGIQVPLIESRGKVVLIVANTYATNLSNELARLQQDLTGDGWVVLRHDVNPSDSVPSVKGLIQTDYNADPANVKAVFLFGHVPVPYSGNFDPDEHLDHLGAWSADVYYGDMTGTWTDSTVNSTSAENSRNWNVPGDGKFDQSAIPSDVELQVGRVDLSDMPSFAPLTELDLLRQYLNKDHNFRFGLISAQRRGLICDNFGEINGESPASSAWRNFAPLFGPAATTEVSANQYFSTLASQSYLCSYACGGGSYTSAQNVGVTGDFVTTDIQSVFTMLFGSYFGDWDKTDDFLRAPLATSTYGLTCAWVGFPHWYFHHMALGQTIGYSTRLSQNNGVPGLYQARVNAVARGVQMALMGDPTLRLHTVLPPSNLANTSGTGVALSWTSSADTVQGYHVYRATSAAGPFTRLTGSLIAGNSFTDTTVSAGTYTYMVRAIKLETSGGGTYFNPSQGTFLSVSVSVTTANTSCSPGPLGLVDWWPGDGNANDIQGTNNGTLHNGTTFTTGEVAQAFNFDGVTNTVSVGPIYASLVNNFTMEFWVNPLASRAVTAEATTGITGTSNQRYAIFPEEGATYYGAGQAGAGVSVGTNGISVFEHSDNYLTSLLVYNATISGWTHIAVVYQNRQPQLYVNGVLQRTGLTSTFTVHPSADLSGIYGYFQGGLDEIGIYNRALTANEVQSIYTAGAGGLCKTIKITAIKELSPGQTQLTLQGKTGSFGIDASTNLVAWLPLATLTNTSGTIQYLDPTGSGFSRRFYRPVSR
ncbi:MAG: hypothetical protein JWR19_3689 [Pedosphaera sp.]|nr:hypothetical protein [Pedosphaera sp.]